MVWRDLTCRCIWCQRLLPTIEVLAEALGKGESEPEITVATVDCTVEKELCTQVFNIRVGGQSLGFGCGCLSPRR